MFTIDRARGRAQKSYSVPTSMRAFSRDESGGMIVFTLFILICMLLAIGMAIDTVRTEFTRIKLQNTTDAAILAAADLEQTLEPRAVVEDYFLRAGIDPSQVDITVSKGLDSREVSATTRLQVPTMFMDMVGIRNLAAPASGTAKESVTEIEIVLVLDNSGSMAQNNNLRLNLLKPAAKNFVDQVLSNEHNAGSVAISIVPFATQVSAGPDLLKHFNASDEHDLSHCVTFDTADFATTALPTTQPLERTAHFDPRQRKAPPRAGDLVCSTRTSRRITPWSDDADLLKARIDAMVGQGWTSIEVGAKWGAALLDPSTRPVVNAMADAGLVDAKFRGQPFDFHSSTEGVSRMKYLVIMSDGANTSQWDIRDPYRSGASPVHRYRKADGAWTFAYYKADREGPNKYWVMGQGWSPAPADSDHAVQLDWPEVWAAMSVKYFTENIAAKALGGSGSDYYGQIVRGFASSTKNSRTSQICKAARDKGIMVFTIGMETYGQGDATLSDCASGIANFYDVKNEDLDKAFAAIARTINQLRLSN